MHLIIFFVKLISRLILCLFRVPDFHIVTGASSSHYYSLSQLLNSITILHKRRYKITVYDLGLTKEQQVNLHSKFPEIEFKQFCFEGYPSYVNIKINAGEYAWKPIIINQEYQLKKTPLIWLDAGSFLYDSLWFYQIWTFLIGFYSPFSAGSVKDWTHHLTLQRMKVSNEFLSYRNLSGGLVAVSANSKKAKEIIMDWSTLALDHSVIAPEGSNRSNHRQDQAVLTLLFWSKFGKVFLYGKHYGVKVQADID